MRNDLYRFFIAAVLSLLFAGCASPQPTATSNPPSSTAVPTSLPIEIPTSTIIPSPTVVPTEAQSLRAFAFQRGIQIGAAVSSMPLFKDKAYAQTLAREFSMLVPENAMKFDALHPGQSGYDFTEADALVKFAMQNGMQVRGHTLVWHNQLPDWVTKGSFTRDEAIAILKDHIMTVVGHYRGQVAAWDVVNEAVNDDGSLRDSIWLQTIGPDYIDMAFTWAHEADPDAKLFYNDYSNEDMGKKSDAIYNLLKDMIQRGIPVNGEGFQMHLDVNSTPQPKEVIANMKRLGELGLEVHITEMDVRIKDPPTDKLLAKQATVYKDMLGACLSVENCKAFVLWGFTDKYSWIPQFISGYGSALIFDYSFNPKPAYTAMLNALSGQ